MAYQNKPLGSGGALYNRERRSNNGPSVGGPITLTGEELAYVVANASSGKVDLEVSGWSKQGQQGPFTSLAIQIPYKVRQPQATTQGYQQRQAYQPPSQNRYAQATGGGPTVPLHPQGQQNVLPMRDQPPRSVADQRYQQRVDNTREFARGDGFPDEGEPPPF